MLKTFIHKKATISFFLRIILMMDFKNYYRMALRNILIISFLCAIVGFQNGAYNAIRELKPGFNLPNEIVKGFNNGDAKAISQYFNSSVELIFTDSRGVYGKAQAEKILKNFFNDNVDAKGKFDYKHLHNIDKDNVQYYIGELTTGKGRYRINIYMKDQLIYEMRVEGND
jgi:hypothetical protein